jgi:adenylosuccinate synthase
MPVTIVIGTQWGDEAKGKISDILAEDADIVARFNGGDNAGHTVVNQFGTFKQRLIPSGIFNEKAVSVVGPGVVLNLNTITGELLDLASRGIDIKDRLWISPRCHIVLPYHKLIEELTEKAKGDLKTGTTKRGMSPVYADKVSYNGIRLFDLMDRDKFLKKVTTQLAIKNPTLEAFGFEALEAEKIVDDVLEKFEMIQNVVREPIEMIHNALIDQANVLVEGAQSTLLDNTWGTYPYCTSSTTVTGGITAGLGIAPKWIRRVIGVAKTYSGRVGNGPFPTELLDETGDHIREVGQEYGTVTGRPRRCGWFDAELVRFSSMLNGVSEIALTKLDVLDNLPEIKFSTHYETGENNQKLRYWEGDADALFECDPVYETMDGWMESTANTREYSALPENAQNYIERLENLLGYPISMVSVGPGREEIISKI